MNKELKLKIIKKYNPMHDDYHTGVRSVEDIKANAVDINSRPDILSADELLKPQPMVTEEV